MRRRFGIHTPEQHRRRPEAPMCWTQLAQDEMWGKMFRGIWMEPVTRQGRE